MSVKALLDSSPALPDTTEFTLKDYHTRYTPDYVARPTVGYERNNFGRGFFGGTAISLSDILGNHTMVFSGSVNGRLSEAQVLAAYINQAHRLNWAFGGSQQPLYFYLPTTVTPNTDGTTTFTPQIERFVIRDLFAQAFYPFNRFTRVELGGHFSNISQSVLQEHFLCDPSFCQFQDEATLDLGSVTYYGPQVALVHDNSLFGFVGPFAGARSRFELSPSFGDWRFTAGLADWRRYLFFRPFTLAVRGLFFGRFGRDAELFPQYLGSTELLRGYTAGSILNNECLNPSSSSNGVTGCSNLDQLIGSKIAVFNAELRFPLTRSLVLGFLPVGLPPIEGALFYDMGLAWNGTSCDGSPGSCVVWNRGSQDQEVYRTPLRSWGGSIRMNFLGFVVLRFDYTKPINRPDHPNAYWTVSLRTAKTLVLASPVAYLVRRGLLRIRGSYLVLISLTLWGCRSRAPAAASSQPQAKQAVSKAAAGAARTAGVAIRIPAKGGVPRVYRLPSLVEIPTAIRGRLPQVRRVIGLDPEAEFLYVTTPQRDTTSKRKGAKAKSDTTLKSDVLALDLGSARVDTVATAIEQATLGPDGTLYTVDAKGRVVSVARRVRVAWPQPLPAVPQQLFGAADQRLVAADPPKLITAAADQPPTSRPLPAGSDVAATRWGDVVAVATDSGVLLMDPLGRRDATFIALSDHPRALVFSPSGHRIYVARRTEPGLGSIGKRSTASRCRCPPRRSGWTRWGAGSWPSPPVETRYGWWISP